MFKTHASSSSPDTGNWLAFPGGELEGRPPRGMCRACRERATRTGTLCFQCYRADLDRQRALKTAAELDTASDARFQSALPFEPVNRPRLERLRIERTAARTLELSTSTGSFASRQRHARIAARHALERLATATPVKIDMAIHAAELQLPEAWLPFVVSL